MGIQPEKRKNDTGESVFPETDPFSLFSGLLIYLLLHIETNGGEGDGTPLQYSCLENPMDRGAWQAPVHGVAKSQT